MVSSTVYVCLAVDHKNQSKCEKNLNYIIWVIHMWTPKAKLSMLRFYLYQSLTDQPLGHARPGVRDYTVPASKANLEFPMQQ